MQDLFDFLFRHPFAVFVVAVWVIGVLSQVMSRAAKKAKKVRQDVRRPESLGPVGQEPVGQPTHRSAPQRQTTSEEIAAEIRRMMGGETADARRQTSGPVVEEDDWDDDGDDDWEGDWRPEQTPEPQPVTIVQEPERERGSLHERMVARGKETVHLGKVERRHLQPSALGRVAQRHLSKGLGTLTEVLGRRGELERLRRRVDLSDPASAFIMMEVLGPPKAMRENDGF